MTHYVKWKGEDCWTKAPVGRYDGPMNAQNAAGLSTRALHGGREADEALVTVPKTMPLYETSVFVYEDLAQVDDYLAGNPDNYMYTRLGNPNQRALELWGRDLEGGEEAVACASGMAALMTVISAACGAGDRVLAARDLYGGTQSLLKKELARFGVEPVFVDLGTLTAADFTPSTKLVLAETLSNPLMVAADIPRLGDLARQHRARLVVDNTFLSPVLFRPLEHGADAVIHSTTKYINGHSDATGGLIVTDSAWAAACRRVVHNAGALLAPFEAWLTLRGAKTLALRMDRHTANARSVAAWLEGQTSVARVFSPELDSHPQRDLVRRLLTRGCGGMLSFTLAAADEAQALRRADRFIQSLALIQFAPSLAGVTTTVSHPGKTSHRGLSPAELAAQGLSLGTIRLSVGLEDIDDILSDLRTALEAAAGEE